MNTELKNMGPCDRYFVENFKSVDCSLSVGCCFVEDSLPVRLLCTAMNSKMSAQTMYILPALVILFHQT